jgi:hypothetical protein
MPGPLPSVQNWEETFRLVDGVAGTGEGRAPQIFTLAHRSIRRYRIFREGAGPMRRVPAILIVIFLACPLLFGSFVAISLCTWALDRNFYLSLLDDARLFQIPDALGSASWSTSVIEGTGGLQWKSLDRAARVVLTPDYLRAQAAGVVNQVFDFFEGRSRQFDISFDTRPVKAALQGDAGKKFARLLAEDLPVGGNGSRFTVSPGRLPVSRPASVSVQQAAAIIQAGLPTLVRSIPDTMRLSDEPTIRVGTNPWGGGPQFHLFGALLAGSIILLLVAAGFLTAAAFIGGESRFERLQWLGWSLLAPAAGALLTGLVAVLVSYSPWVPWGIRGVQMEIHGFSVSSVSALVDAAERISSRAGIGLLATGGIAAGIALGLLAWSWSIPRDERRGVPSHPIST